MNESVRCNLCGNDDYDVIYPSTIRDDEILTPDSLSCTNPGHGSHHRIVRCKSCRLVYANPRDPASLLPEFYKKVKDIYYGFIVKSRRKAFTRSLVQIEKIKKVNRLLDIGCYTGVFMEVASARGWRACGIEPSEWASRIGREKGMDIKNCAVEDIEKADGKFDLITMWDTIEHLGDPCGTLRLCLNKLNPAGAIAITTMRCEGLFYALCGRRWPWFMRMHLYYFTLSTLTKMLEKAGFKIILSRPYVHYMSANYFLYKIGVQSSFFLSSRLLEWLAFPVQLGDFMEVYAIREN